MKTITKRDNLKTAAVITVFTAVPLIIGFLYYVFNMPDTYVSQIIYGFFGKPEFIKSEENIFLKGYLCDICWAAALESSVILILPKSKKYFIASVIASALISTLIELLQLFGITSGTFDIIDIIAETASIIISGTIIYFIFRRKSL